jgi:hypothetical protein
MTITAVNAVVARVVFMRELHGLLPFQIPVCQIRRTSDLRVGVTRHACQNDYHCNARLRNIICSAMKYLCHLVLSETLQSCSSTQSAFCKKGYKPKLFLLLFKNR